MEQHMYTWNSIDKFEHLTSCKNLGKTTMARRTIVQAPLSGGKETHVSTPSCRPVVIERREHYT
jgi:hypothetical protein